MFHEGGASSITFHPKIYCFANSTEALVVTGSTNLTESGLFRNHEASTVLKLDRTEAMEDAYFQEVTTALADWQDTTSASYQAVDGQLLQTLHDHGDLPSETTIRAFSKAASSALRTSATGSSGSTSNGGSKSLFKPSSSLTAPPPPPFPSGLPAGPVVPTTPKNPPAFQQPTAGVAVKTSAVTAGSAKPTGQGVPLPQAAQATQLYMEVRPHHNGEVFLSYRAVMGNPKFFGHPFTGWTTPRTANTRPYPMSTPDPLVEILVYDVNGKVTHRKAMHNLNLVDYERKREIRITLPERLQDHVPEMSLLIMTKDPDPVHDFRLEFHPPGSTTVSAASGILTTSLPKGGVPVARRYGWN